MSKKYEEMAREELGNEADEILRRFRMDTAGNTSVWIGDIDNLQKIVNAMKNYGISEVKEKVDNVLGGFVDRNREYSISGCIRNGVGGSTIANFLLPIDRKIESNKRKFFLRSGMDGVKNVNDIIVPYDEVSDCYEEKDEYNQQMVYVVLKNGIRIDFECVGIKI